MIISQRTYQNMMKISNKAASEGFFGCLLVKCTFTDALASFIFYKGFFDFFFNQQIRYFLTQFFIFGATGVLCCSNDSFTRDSCLPLSDTLIDGSRKPAVRLQEEGDGV